MDFPEKRLFVVGDRVLISPEDGDDRTPVGLYLPATAIDAQQVQNGLIVATGPGDPVPDVSTLDEEPWKVSSSREPRYRSMQARVGDHAIFFRKAAVEITSWVSAWKRAMMSEGVFGGAKIPHQIRDS